MRKGASQTEKSQFRHLQRIDNVDEKRRPKNIDGMEVQEMPHKSYTVSQVQIEESRVRGP